LSKFEFNARKNLVAPSLTCFEMGGKGNQINIGCLYGNSKTLW